MFTSEQLMGKWKQVTGAVREKWGQFSDDDFEKVKGNSDKLIGMIQERTGTARKEIESFFQNIVDKSPSVVNSAADTASKVVNQAVETARDYSGKAAEVASNYAASASNAVRDGYKQVTQRVEDGYNDAQVMVKSRPVESIAAAFGAGLISGVIVTLLLRSSRN